MTELKHETFEIVRTYPKCRAHVWSAWADAAKKKRWIAPEAEAFSHDFRPGGTAHHAFTNDMGLHENRTTYFEIAEESRIVFAYSMAMNGRVHSVSLTTVTFADEGGGTRVTFHERITVIGPSDGAAGREHGWGVLLDRIGPVLDADTETAA